MSTVDRTTLNAALGALVDGLRNALTADPPAPDRPFRRVVAGQTQPYGSVRPFLNVRLVKSEPISVVAGDKAVRVTLALRLVTDVTESDPHGEICNAVGAVDDYFDSLLSDEAPVIDGADGFDDRGWTFGYPAASVATRVAEASCTQTFILKVRRGENRVVAARILRAPGGRS